MRKYCRRIVTKEKARRLSVRSQKAFRKAHKRFANNFFKPSPFYQHMAQLETADQGTFITEEIKY